MVQVDREDGPEGTVVKLAGTIEESVDLSQLFGEFTGVLSVNCKGVTRINSVGVKTWIRYFQGLKSTGRAFKFLDLPHPLIEQLNMISNFACGGEVVSVLLPYGCNKCSKEFVASVKTAELKANGLEVPKVKCEREDCGATFDDDPEEFLYFLQD